MFRKIIQIFIIALLTSLFFPWRIMASEKTYYFPQVNVVININSDGSIHVVETRTARFNGSFTRLYWDIQLVKNQEMREIEILEINDSNQISYTQLPAPDSSRPINSYAFEKNSTGVHIETYFAANYTDKTFALSYDLNNAITKYRDIAELYWKAIGDGWGARTDAVDITVTLPKTVDQSKIYVWGH